MSYLCEGENMNTGEKRDCVRISTESRGVAFFVRGFSYQGLIENYCHSGAFIKTKERFSRGQDISMTIESPKFGTEKRTGVIVRATPDGIGVEFNYPGYTRR